MWQVAFTLVVLFLLQCSFAQSGEPIKFRGAYIGEPLSDFVDCSHGKPKSIRDGYKTYGKLCERSTGTISRIKSKRAPLGGMLNPSQFKLDGETFGFIDGKLFTVIVYVPNDDWSKVKYDLTQKLGEPISQVPEVFQNAFGARWEYNQGFWQKADIVAFAGVDVETIGNRAELDPWSHAPMTHGIEVRITDSDHAKLPSTTANSLD
jgi:hypothetical protein